jgi:hypothetical protein
LDISSSTSNSGTGTTLTTASVATNFASELLIAAFIQTRSASATAPTLSTPTNGFTIEQNQGKGAGDVNTASVCAYSDNTVASIGSYSTGLTSNVSSTWASLIVTFKSMGGFATRPMKIGGGMVLKGAGPNKMRVG